MLGLLKAELLQSVDPTFDAGSKHTAKARMTNLSDIAVDYNSELYLGASKTSTSGFVSFHLEPNESKDINYFVTIPLVDGNYPVFIDVWIGGILAVHYRATENVIVVTQVPTYDITLGVSDTTPNIGETVSWWVDIKNTGGSPGSPTIQWRRDGVTVSTVTSSSIAPNETKKVYGNSFSLSAVGNHTLEVVVDGISDSLIIVVQQPGEADIRVSSLTINPTEPEIGETVTFGVVVKNHGSISGSRVITCEVLFGGTTIFTDSEAVTLNAGQSKNITFQMTTGYIGGHIVIVDTLNGSFPVVSAPIANVFWTVTDASNNNPLSSVKVTHDSFVVYTDSYGQCGFVGLTHGTHIFTFEKVGYEALTVRCIFR